ncbi:GGDEF domain-containing protein [Xanthobacter dioxanivorans]|uniref:diguanylate cyclase n=1 Tax=Xanthobacter dioxanivorans TaxID=2528964 RepID=A0A974PKW0_9HYPH|nr:GGDEF domain-containing protein [Xanthobacter dioxanivorans]QRG04925.1 GGDEF domain-containing protein [Xanthobacter dioxanivorans]
MQFHVQTMLGISALVGVMLASMQLLAAVRLRASPLAFWGLSNLALSGGCLAIAARPSIGLPVSALAGNGLVFLGMGLLFSGIRTFDDRPAHVTWVLASAVAGALALGVSLAFGDNAPDRVSIASLIVAAWAGLSAVALLESSGSGPVMSRLPAGLLMAGIASIFLLRGIAAQFGYGGALHPLDTPAEHGTLVVSLGLAVAWSFGSLFMVLERLASVDDLTGLLNRRATLQRAVHFLGVAKARRIPLSVLLADLDHFKSVNDRFGHETGDAVLRHFALLMPGAVRPSDIVGRYGGEEFCIVLPGADEKGAHLTAERLRALAEECLVRVEGRDTRVTLSVGAATFLPSGPDLADVSELINTADGALYAAKASGRNCVVSARQNALRVTGARPGPRIAAGPAA